MIDGLVLHLGDFRSGSTAIQDWLGRAGAAHGLVYPPGFNQAALAQSLSDPEARAARFAALAAGFEAAPGGIGVISSEHFEFADPETLRATLAEHLPGLAPRARLIAYVRPHAPAFLARFAESAKIGNFDGPLEAYLQAPATLWRLGYAARFGRWRKAFGDRFTLRLYDRAQFPHGDVRADFLRFVTGTAPAKPLPPAAANPTPGIADLAMAMALHRAIGPLPEGPPAQGARWTLGRHLGRLMADRTRPRPDSPLHLHRDLATRLAARFKADAEATDAAFFAPAMPLANALAAAPDAAPEAAQSLAAEDHLSPEARDLVALWGGMLRHGLSAPEGPALLERLYHE